MAKMFSNSRDPDQMRHSVASGLGLHCLLVTLLRVSRLKWINNNCYVLQSQSKMILFQR